MGNLCLGGKTRRKNYQEEKIWGKDGAKPAKQLSTVVSTQFYRENKKTGKKHPKIKNQNQGCVNCDRDLEKSNYLATDLADSSLPIKCPDNIFKPITILIETWDS